MDGPLFYPSTDTFHAGEIVTLFRCGKRAGTEEDGAERSPAGTRLTAERVGAGVFYEWERERHATLTGLRGSAGSRNGPSRAP